MRPYIVTYDHIDESVSYRLIEDHQLINKSTLKACETNDEPEFEVHKLK